MTFTESPNCTSRFNCAAFCLVNPEWRKMQGAPDVCLFGVTLENHPAILKESLAKHQAMPVLTHQPGDILAKVIHALTGESPCGLCDQHRQDINAMGWTGAVRNIKVIAGWVEEEALKRGKALDSATVISAIWKYVKEGLKAEKENLTQSADRSKDNNSVQPSPVSAEEKSNG